MSHLVGVYRYFNLEIERASGIYLYTKDGKKFIDTFSGIGVLAFGHGDLDIQKAIVEKVSRYTHLSNFFLDEDAETVASKLVEKVGKDGKVFFANSGTEANEAALKAVKKFKKGLILSFQGNFHGRTIGSLSITGFEKLREPFEPLLEGVVILPHNDVEKFLDFVEKHHAEISAIFVEPLLGSGGIKPLSSKMAEAIMYAKREYGIVLVVDEVQAGLGRTGKFFCYEHFNLEPDVITVAKALGGGLPLAAVIFTGDLKEVFTYSQHGSTFAPNPVALSAAKVVLEKLTNQLVSEVREKGDYFKKKLSLIQSEAVRDVRGLGLMIGVEVSVDGDILKESALNHGLLLNIVGGNVVRFLPALNITYDQIDEIVELFEKSLREVSGERDRAKKNLAPTS
ncbi:aspartate aminotransferase family protein [Pseudothermotoga thermarum]|uniref:Aminotransferase class-III n=1 Tax=Pseudothermotoga thermarum DSM 5069 TaxID=688269 RepID=F7YWF4_9THEM|nr:aminotransferase class III-fold pyridoxal phosphate-dependent enzyme [Pseudothermotoga thermarum]AEH51932.1 aminotransferase class-III [Pseudothermotoga thermarum DSM 5069]